MLELSGKNDRAEYGKKLLEYLSEHLTKEFGKGFTVANLKNLKYIKIGKSGLPVEMPLVSTQDRNMAVMLTDSFGFQQAKDAVTIASNYQRDIFVFGKK